MEFSHVLGVLLQNGCRNIFLENIGTQNFVGPLNLHSFCIKQIIF